MTINNRNGYSYAMIKLNKAIEIVGGQKLFAEKLGVGSMAVTHWKNRQVPASYCREIQKLTDNKVKASDLRPDIFGGLD